jgi:hypothetical protein
MRHTVDVTLKMKTKNSYNPSLETEIQCGITIPLDHPWFDSEEDLVIYIRDELVTRMELHERDEWFKFDHKLIKDPHD